MIYCLTAASVDGHHASSIEFEDHFKRNKCKRNGVLLELICTVNMEPEPIPVSEPVPEPEPGRGVGIPFITPRSHSNAHDIIIAAEPFPDIQNAGKTWSIVWPMYTYSLGSLFAILGLYSMCSMVGLLCFSTREPIRRKTIRPFIIAIHSQMMLLGMCRAIDLLVDPYNIGGTLPPVIYAIIFNVPFPCLSSAFGLVNWVIIRVSKIKMNSASRIRSVTFLITVIVSHYIVVIAVAIFTHLVMRMDVLIIVCQGFFVVWGMLLCVGFFIGAIKIHNLDKFTKHARASLHKSKSNSTLLTPKINRKTWLSLTPTSSPQGSPFVSRKAQSASNKRGEKANGAVSSAQVYSITAEMLTPLRALATPAAVDVQGKQKTNEFKFHSSGGNKSANQDEERFGGISTTRLTLTNIVLETTQPVSYMNSQPLASETTTRVQRRRPRNKTTKVMRISAAAALLGFAASGLNLFGILVVFSGGDVKLGGDGIEPGLWEWYSYQLMLRLVELSMACTMAYFTCEPSLRRR